MRVADAYAAIKAEFPDAVLVLSDEPEMTDDDIELGDGAAVQVCVGPRGQVGFYAKFSYGEGDEFASWDANVEDKDPVAAARRAVQLRADVLAKVGG